MTCQNMGTLSGPRLVGVPFSHTTPAPSAMMNLTVEVAEMGAPPVSGRARTAGGCPSATPVTPLEGSMGSRARNSIWRVPAVEGTSVKFNASSVASLAATGSVRFEADRGPVSSPCGTTDVS